MSFLQKRPTFITTKTYPSKQPQGYSNKSESPFNDLWPPTYFPNCRRNQVDSFARSVWFHWLINGWTNDRPYRELQVLDYHPLSIENRRRIQQPIHRSNQVNARRQHIYTYQYINCYRLRNRVVTVRKRFKHKNLRPSRNTNKYSYSPPVTLGHREPTVDYSLTFPKY